MLGNVSAEINDPSERLLSENNLPNRRSFMRNMALAALGYGAFTIGLNASDVETKIAPKDVLELLKLIATHYGKSATFRERFEQVYKEVDINTNNSRSTYESRMEIITSSIKKSSSFAVTIPTYLANYQQESKSADNSSYDCNDCSRAAGDFCYKIGLVSYHISVSPKYWSDIFRTSSHQFHAVKLSSKLFLFIDGSSSDYVKVTLWHGTLQSFVDQYRIEDRPVQVISGIGITKHTAHTGMLRRLAAHLTESVPNEKQMQSNELNYNSEAGRFIASAAKLVC